MSTHDIADRVDRLGERVKGRWASARMEKIDRDNERLRTDVALLRDDLDEERASLKEALKGLSSKQPVTVKDRRPHVLRAVIIAAGAYVLGTKAGRERYEQIVHRAREVWAGVRDREQDEGPWIVSEPERAVPSEPSS